MTIKFANNASTTVAGSITAADTTVNLAAGTGIFFPPIAAGSGNYFCATFYDQATKTVNEIVHCTAVSGDTVTIVRGLEGTIPRAWTSGDIFANLVTAGTLDAFVQAGPIAANTSLIYTGIDTSVNPAHIVCNTNPVPPSYIPGMVFTIKVGAAWPASIYTNNGPVDCQFNGVPAVFAKRTDGSDMIPGDFFANQEYVFVYNGTFFSTTLQNVPQAPPQFTFYVRSDSLSIVDMTTGFETGSGLANTPQDSFKTIQGAMNTIANRYISAQTITIRVADGTYTSGAQVSNGYISSWSVIGNSVNPASCFIDCTSTADASYVPGSRPGYCFCNLAGGTITVNGFSCQSRTRQIINNGLMYLMNVQTATPLDGSPAISTAIGVLFLSGTIQFTSTSSSVGFIAVEGGVANFGWASIYPSQQRTLHLTYVGTIAAVVVCIGGGSASIYDTYLTVSGTPPSQGWIVNTGGGIGFTSNSGALGAPGTIGQTTTTSIGGWFTTGGI
jgi:hypothetical protein